MTVKILSNRAAYFRGNAADGIGGRNLPDGIIGWVGLVSNEANDVAYLSATDVTSSNHPYLAYTFQAVGGSVNIEFTCQNVGTATNPDPATQSQISWCNPETIAPGTFTIITYGFSAVKITFATAGTELYVVSR